MIDPGRPAPTSRCATIWDTKNVALTLRSITASKSASLTATKSVWRASPALLTRMSKGATPPKNVRTAPKSLTSSACPLIGSPASLAVCTVWSMSPAVRATMVTAAPASASATAAPRPIPRVPPVTRARRPSSRKLGVRGKLIDHSAAARGLAAVA